MNMRGFCCRTAAISAPFTPPAAIRFQPSPTDAFRGASIGISDQLQFSASPTIAILGAGLGAGKRWQALPSGWSQASALLADLDVGNSSTARRYRCHLQRCLQVSQHSALAATSGSSCSRRRWQSHGVGINALVHLLVCRKFWNDLLRTKPPKMRLECQEQIG